MCLILQYTPQREKPVVYIGKSELVDDLSRRMNESMKAHGIPGNIPVKFVEGGSIFKNVRLENSINFVVSRVK